MKAYEIICFLENIYPLKSQSNTDNSGLQKGSPKKEVNNIAIAYEKSLDVISRCIRNKCDMLITHRPLTIPKRFGDPPKLWWDSFNKIIADHDMVIYSIHENLDYGINNTGICLSRTLNLLPIFQKDQYLICRRRKMKFSNFIVQVRKTLEPAYIVAVGNTDSIIQRIGIVAGTAMDVKDIDYFVSNSVDCYLSGDPDDFGIRYAKDMGLRTINVDDYCLERPGIMSVYDLLVCNYKKLKIEFIDCRYNNI